MDPIALTILGSGLLVCLISLPLMYAMVPMNHLYGIRIAAAFESDERWYEINAYGGRRMAAWSLLIIVAGLAGLFVSPEHKDVYALSSIAVTLLAVMVPVIQVLRWSRKYNA